MYTVNTEMRLTLYAVVEHEYYWFFSHLVATGINIIVAAGYVEGKLGLCNPHGYVNQKQ